MRLIFGRTRNSSGTVVSALAIRSRVLLRDGGIDRSVGIGWLENGRRSRELVGFCLFRLGKLYLRERLVQLLERFRLDGGGIFGRNRAQPLDLRNENLAWQRMALDAARKGSAG